MPGAITTGSKAATNGSANRIYDRLPEPRPGSIPEQFNAIHYVKYLRERWRFLAIAPIIAMLSAMSISLLLPKQYTATASILIDAPGTDPRMTTAVSPIYLESLKTYEHFAESDTLFLQAMEKFHLRDKYPGAAPDSLRRRVLRVTKPRDTKILEVRATLRDPVKAQALTQYIAEQTVGLNQTLSKQSDLDLWKEGQRQIDVAHEKLQQAERALQDETASRPYEALQADVDNLVELRARLRREMLETQVDIADYTAQGNQRDLSPARARSNAFEKQLADLDRELTLKERSAAERRTRWEQLNADVRSSRAMAQSADSRMNDLRAAAGNRSERLRIIDPGIVPQRPSSPNILLNVLVALVFAIVCGWFYLTVAYNLRRI